MSDSSESRQPFIVRFDAAGLVPVVAQDAASGDVLLLAYMNAEALERTLTEGVLILWSRSRNQLWRKGEQSGNVLRLRELRVNCEGDSLLARVALEGMGACHEGYRSCYYRRLASAPDGSFSAEIVEPRIFDPTAVYGLDEGAGARPSIPPLPAGRETGDEDPAFERDAHALYAAYERLRGGDEIPGSNTSKLLHAPDRGATITHCLGRARQELAELRGALNGTHVHAGGVADVILEAGQVGYWATLAAVAGGHPYDAWRPHEAWLAGWEDAQSPPATASVAADLSECASLLVAAGAICRAAGVHPARVVAADLAAMRAKHP